MKRINKNEGLFFWITGLAGSGKSLISRGIKKYISEMYGPTILVSGDSLRNIFQFRKGNWFCIYN